MKFHKGKIFLDTDVFSNFMNIDGIDYQLEYLDPERPKKSWSPNGFIFKLHDLQEERIAGVIKFCSVPKTCDASCLKRRRFEREVNALYMVKNSKLNDHVIEIYTSGEEKINDETFNYYTMELASGDLSSFLLNQEIEIPERYRICAEIMKSIDSLHQIGIYHRDIKPGNFLMVGSTWKIADLGLVDFREEDISTLDTDNEKIGPRGYLSPEAINKWLGLNRNINLITIDDKSDVFQLAKVVGFILLGEILTGMIEPIDLAEEEGSCRLFLLLSRAMQYAKSRRCDLNMLRSGFVNAYGKEYVFS